MQIEQIPIDKLIAHPANANVMNNDKMDKLRKHIEQHKHYEPLIVRLHPKQTGCYELINGHHRKQVLKESGYLKANCIVWQVSDEETLILLATMNRLSGDDEPIRRAKLLQKLSQSHQPKELLKKLPETREQLKKLLALNKPPRKIKPENITNMPMVMNFFVTKHEKEIIEKALRKINRIMKNTVDGKHSRGAVLAYMADGCMGVWVYGCKSVRV